MQPENPWAPRTHGTLVPLSPRCLLWRSTVNSTVFIGDQALAVIDTQVNRAQARRLLGAIRQISPLPIAWAVNTHYHWDHTNGNQIFAEAGATLVASRRTVRAMDERSQLQKAFLSGRGFPLGPDPQPASAFAEDLDRLDLGGIHLDLRLGLRAETADPTLVFCPEERVLVSGDTVMTGSFPILGQPSQQEGLEDAGWLEALDEVRDYDATVIAPGHGPEAHGPDLDRLGAICRYFLDAVREQKDHGRTLDETISAVEASLPDWIRAIPAVWGTPRYAILRVWAGLSDLRHPGWMHVKPQAFAWRFPRQDPAGDLPIWLKAAEEAKEGGDTALALGTARLATETFSRDPAAWTAYGKLLIEASRDVGPVLEKGDFFAAALPALEHAVALKPTYAPALLALARFQLALAFRNGDDPDPGLAWLDRLGPGLTPEEQAEAAFCRGLACRCRDDEAAAQTHFRAALALDPACTPAALALRT